MNQLSGPTVFAVCPGVEIDEVEQSVAAASDLVTSSQVGPGWCDGSSIEPLQLEHVMHTRAWPLPIESGPVRRDVVDPGSDAV